MNLYNAEWREKAKDIVFNETQFNVYDESKATKHAIEEWNNKHFQNYVEHSCLHSD